MNGHEMSVQAEKMQCECVVQVDRMISEGLGGGFILSEYDGGRLDDPVSREREVVPAVS
ncbi:hypothetical protein [Bhargavaea cecembensis]|uniref:hypothetical protein n=1 Tax=Bhargavaea cecembensis TaxID=394098 RepID=UPI0015CF0904|nr:hypothetical protein [Bhargavaea cecembensis]